jgi:UDP-glucose 4-epimerase
MLILQCFEDKKTKRHISYNIMKQTILVTGGTGFIGSHTTVELQQAGYNVVIVDNLSNSKIEVLDGIEKITGIRPAFENVDLRDLEATEKVFAKYPDIEGIIHFAASKAVGESVQKPLLYYRNNIVSLVNLLELMPKYNVKGIIFSSSCTVYGQPTPENLPVTENAPIQPALSPYGNTKQVNEEIIRDYIHSGANIKSIVLRYFNPIGAHPSALIGELPNGVPMNLIPFVTQTAIGVRKELKIFGNDYNTPDGTCIRDYIYVVDLAKAHVAAMARVLDQETEPIEYFNIGTGTGVSTLEVVEGFERATGVKVNWQFAPRREGDIEKVWGNVDKANKMLGWKADTPLEDVLRSAWKWQLKLREDGIM